MEPIKKPLVILTCECGWTCAVYSCDGPEFIGKYLHRHLDRHHAPESNAVGGASDPR